MYWSTGFFWPDVVGFTPSLASSFAREAWFSTIPVFCCVAGQKEEKTGSKGDGQ
jgi:hypothetical protein